MLANPWRGEVTIVLDGNAYVMRPVFEALSRVEQTLSTGMVALARKLAEGTITLEELAVIIAQCMQSDIPVSFIKEALLRSGLAHGMMAVADMFALIFGGFDESDS